MLAVSGMINPQGIIRNLNMNLRTQSDAMARLSSGLRINKASDDPAGLTLSEQLRSQIEGLERAVRNTETSGDMLSIMDGSLGIVQGVLTGMRKLAVAAANTGVANPEQLAGLQSEMDSSLQSIARILNSTSMGGRQLLSNLSDEGKLTLGAVDPDASEQVDEAAPPSGDGEKKTGAARGRPEWVEELLRNKDGALFDDPPGDSAVDGGDATLFLDPDGDGVPGGSPDEELLAREIEAMSDKDKALYDLGNAFSNSGLSSLGAITLPGGLNGLLSQRTLTLEDLYSGGSASLTEDPVMAMRIIEAASRDTRNQRAQIGAARSMQANEVAAMEANLENLRRTESGVRDTEYAETMTELVRSQIASQAGFKMLDAAMEQNKSVLELLSFS